MAVVMFLMGGTTKSREQRAEQRAEIKTTPRFI